MPRFWLVTLVFALASGLLLGPKATRGTGAVLSPEGLQAGLLMVLRGVFIFETLKRLTARIGLARLGTSLSTALQLLPELKDRINAHAQRRQARVRWFRLRRFPELAVEVICETARLAAEMASPAADGSRRPLRVAVTGAPGSGKTTLVGDLLRRLRERGLEVGGITQPALVEGGERVGYQLRDERTGEERLFARRSPRRGGAERRREKRGEGELGFSFDAEAWAWAAERIRRARAEADVLVVDELGRLEARGEGHLPALVERVKADRVRALVLSVRADCAPALEEQLGRFDRKLAVGGDGASAEKLADEIVRACEGSERSAATIHACEPDAPSAS